MLKRSFCLLKEQKGNRKPNQYPVDYTKTNKEVNMENQETIIIPSPEKSSEPNLRNYTSITNAIPNCKIVRLLKNLLSGRYGALTNHLSYLYQYYIYNNSNPNLASSIRSLATKAETHMQQLATAIIAFGGCPKFSNGQGSPWSSRYINYVNNIPLQIASNIKRETIAIKELERIIALSLNSDLNSILLEIVADKKSNIQVLNNLL